MTKKPTTSDSVDIKESITGPIGKVIKQLQALALKYPKGKVEIGTHSEYGETYDHAYLNFERDMTALEIEITELDAKCRRHDEMRQEAAVFTRNDKPYPKAEEMEALKKELGFFAMAPMRGTLRISDGEIIVVDMMRGGRRRDGTWVFRMMHGMGEDIDKMFEEGDAEYQP